MNLRWNTSDYGGVKDLRIPPHRIWKPDVLMYNSADEGFDGTYQTNVVVRNNGSCLYVPPGIFKSTCKIDITWFPFDDQRCEMKFGSWTYDGFQVWFSLPPKQGNQEVLNLPKRTRSCYAWPIYSRESMIYDLWFLISLVHFLHWFDASEIFTLFSPLPEYRIKSWIYNYKMKLAVISAVTCSTASGNYWVSKPTSSWGDSLPLHTSTSKPRLWAGGLPLFSR